MTGRGPRLTRRGAALLVVGAATGAAGALLGTLLAVEVGLLLSVAALGGLGWVTLERWAERGTGAVVRRRAPDWIEVGGVGTVEVELTSAHPIAHLDVVELAAAELRGDGRLRARVRRSRDRLSLTYRVRATRRGRWRLGPLEVRRTDPLGLASAVGPLGRTALLAVRPRVWPLSGLPPAGTSDLDTAASGTRHPSADDAALREYSPGDDLRRVHWASSARRGGLVVRQDERSARRVATVLLDLPIDRAATERAVELAASVATALHRAGHPVTLLTAQGEATGIDAVLELCVDLVAPQDGAQAEAWAAQVCRLATGGHRGLVVALVRELPPDALAALAAADPGWAVVLGGADLAAVRDPGAAGAVVPGPGRTAGRLAAAGWSVCLATPDDEVTTVWSALLDTVGRIP